MSLMTTISMLDLVENAPTERDAYRYLEDLRWADTPICAHCGSERVFFLNPANQRSRKTRTGAHSERRVWKCGACRKQFSVLTNTVMHGTKIPVRTWLFVIFEMIANKNGVSAREIQRRYKLTPKSAWFLLHRIREAMDNDGPTNMMRGTIVADEAHIGGSLRNMHRSRIKSEPVVAGTSFPHGSNKTAVLSLIDTEMGEARSKVVPDVTGATLRKVIAEQVDMGGSTLHTDESSSYRPFAHEFLAHLTVDHKAGEYVRNGASTNKAENFFSQLKRSLDGTHHHVSRKHLPRYLVEFDFRYSTRKLSDTARMLLLMGRLDGTRLSYRPLTDE